MGQIKPGFVANAVLLSANPVEDITHTSSIEGVINQGPFYQELNSIDSLLIKPSPVARSSCAALYLTSAHFTPMRPVC